MSLALFIAAGIAGYLIHCALWPYKPCRLCHGRKRHMAPTASDERSEAYRHCVWCKGSGERLRLGTRFLRRHRA